MAEETMNPAVENVEAQPEAPKAEVKETKKNEVSKSVQIIDSMYPDLAKNYICYFPTDDNFKRMIDYSDLSFISRRNRINRF